MQEASPRTKGPRGQVLLASIRAHGYLELLGDKIKKPPWNKLWWRVYVWYQLRLSRYIQPKWAMAATGFSRLYLSTSYPHPASLRKAMRSPAVRVGHEG